MRYTKYKKIVKISVFGDDDTWISISKSVYKIEMQARTVTAADDFITGTVLKPFLFNFCYN
jgi:hypothetical protein